MKVISGFDGYEHAVRFVHAMRKDRYGARYVFELPGEHTVHVYHKGDESQAARDLGPEYLRVLEDLDLLTLHCAQCGWAATFPADGVTEESLAEDARQHSCSTIPRPREI